MTSANNRPSILKILKSPTFAIWVAMLSVLVQSFHSFTVFYGVSELKGDGWGIAQAVLFAVIVDLAILFYTVRGNLRVTWMFAFVMVLINAYYYYTHLGFSFAFVMGVLLSFVLPVSVYFYSEEIGDDPESDSADSEKVLKAEEQRDWYAKERDNLLDRIAAMELSHKESTDELDWANETIRKIKAGEIIIDNVWLDNAKSDNIDGPAANKGFANLKSSIPRTDRPSK